MLSIVAPAGTLYIDAVGFLDMTGRVGIIVRLEKCREGENRFSSWTFVDGACSNPAACLQHRVQVDLK